MAGHNLILRFSPAASLGYFTDVGNGSVLSHSRNRFLGAVAHAIIQQVAHSLSPAVSYGRVGAAEDGSERGRVLSFRFVPEQRLRPVYDFAGGARATAASAVSSRNVNVSWR